MAVKRVDNVGIMVEGMTPPSGSSRSAGSSSRGAPIEGDWADGVTRLRGTRVEIAMLRTPDGHGRSELSRFLGPPVAADHHTAPVNALRYLRVMFTAEDIDDTLARLGKVARTSSAKWFNTRTRTGSATSADPSESSSGSPRNSGDRRPGRRA